MIKRHQLLGMPLSFAKSIEAVVEELDRAEILVTYLNPQSYKIERESDSYRDNLSQFDVVVVDGMGIQLGARLLFAEKLPVLTPDFSGIAGAYFELFERRAWRVVLVGGRPEVIARAKEQLAARMPGLSIAGCFSGYGNDIDKAKAFVLETKPECVVAGLGMGLQEQFLIDLKRAGWSGRGIGVGGLFDKLADDRLDYPEWSKRLNIRFVARLIAEPRRLWRRYLIDYQVYVRKLLVEWAFKRRDL